MVSAFDFRKIILKIGFVLIIGAVLEAKAQLVGIHERVRSDIEGNLLPTSTLQPQKDSLSTTHVGVKRVATAMNPNMEDAAELLRYVWFSFSS